MAKHQAAQTRTTTLRASSGNLTHFCKPFSFPSSCLVCKMSTSLSTIRLMCNLEKNGHFFVKSSRPHNCNTAPAAGTLQICLFRIFTPRIGRERLRNAKQATLQRSCRRRGGGFVSSLITKSVTILRATPHFIIVLTLSMGPNDQPFYQHCVPLKCPQSFVLGFPQFHQ